MFFSECQVKIYYATSGKFTLFWMSSENMRLQVNSHFSGCLVKICDLSPHFCINALPQYLHTCGLSPVCIFSCRFNESFRENARPQIKQGQGPVKEFVLPVRESKYLHVVTVNALLNINYRQTYLNLATMGPENMLRVKIV